MKTYIKDPQAKLDYVFDWTAYLADINDTIASVVFTGVGVVVDSSTHTTKTATAWVSGGTEGDVATLTCQITTASVPARVDEVTVSIKIKNT